MNFGFTPSPSKAFFDAASNKDLTCFPWAICEIKHHGHIDTSEETFGFCQAANGAAVSLTLKSRTDLAAMGLMNSGPPILTNSHSMATLGSRLLQRRTRTRRRKRALNIGATEGSLGVSRSICGHSRDPGSSTVSTPVDMANTYLRTLQASI